MHSICVYLIFKACYSVLNSNTKCFSIEYRNITRYACFQFRNSPYASTIDMIFKWFSQTEDTKIQVQRRGGQTVGKFLETTQSRNYPNLVRSNAVICRTIWGSAPTSLKTVVIFKHCSYHRALMTLPAEDVHSNGNPWYFITNTYITYISRLNVPRSVYLTDKEPKNKIRSKTTPYNNVIRMQRVFMQKIRTCSTSYVTVLSNHFYKATSPCSKGMNCQRLFWSNYDWQNRSIWPDLHVYFFQNADLVSIPFLKWIVEPFLV